MEQQQLSELFAYSLTTSPLVQKSVASYVDFSDDKIHHPPSIMTIWSGLIVFAVFGTPVLTYLFAITRT